MTLPAQSQSGLQTSPWWFRRSMLVLSTLTLCACRSAAPVEEAGNPYPLYHGPISHSACCAPNGSAPGSHAGGHGHAAGSDGSCPITASQLPPQAYSQPYAPATMPVQPPMPTVLLSNWALPGTIPPRPADEYLFDGGDQGLPARVDNEWKVHGLELEDTVVHFDTLDGCTQIQPSNRVPIYAPRFAAVRKVEGVETNLQQTLALGVAQPERAVGHYERAEASTAMQPLQPISQIGAHQANLFRKGQQTGGLMSRVQPIADLNSLKIYEEFSIIRDGIMDQADKARLAEKVQAALVWSKDETVHVAIDQKVAVAVKTEQSAQVTYEVDLPGCPRLQVCKVASTQFAKPGDFVDFTIRFDNVGEHPMGNITIIDNLTTRLEYVPDSAQSSVEAEFFTERNEGDSLMLRWEVTEPLKPGEGGLVRFRCKVR